MSCKLFCPTKYLIWNLDFLPFYPSDEGNKQEGRGWELNIAIFDSLGVKYDHKRLSVQVYAELRAARAGCRRDRNSSGSGSSTTSAFSPWSPASSSESSSAPSARQATSDGGGSQTSSIKKRKFTVPNQVMPVLMKYTQDDL